ncbi:MAG: lysine biosynthesis protein LysW [Candidatus Lokiarchaeota archaeon]|nr:lysine biosynthesis protein LysW [Candidatus Lokiarchaeota archaeon]
MKATCPECFFEFELDEGVILGEILNCEDCGAELEVIEIQKDEIKLQIAETEEEDWGE